MKIYLIRHGETYGNTLKRYVGKTDEKLTGKGIEQLEKRKKIVVDRVYISPMTRCMQTAALLVASRTAEVVNELTECNFGDFENLNYKELSGNENYQKWVDSDGKLPFPNGESVEDFKERSVSGFNFYFEKMKRYEKEYSSENAITIAFVIHNGNIMAIMENLFGGDFYSYSVENGKGYVIEEESGEKTWKKL